MRSIPVLLFLTLATPALASDGVLEINQTCAVETGCFAGDPAGLPVTISSSGSYRLTGNLVIPDENTDGIRIEASDVEIDLAGFSIQRQGCVGATTSCLPAVGTGSGITADDLETRRGNTVRNGSVTGMGLGGVVLGPQSRVEAMHLRWNAQVGAFVGDDSILADNTAIGNTDAGLVGGNRNRATGNVASENGSGVVVREDSLVVENDCVANTVGGIDAGARSQVLRNVSNSNGLVGIGAGQGSLVSANQVSLNQSIGIFALNPARVTDNLLRGNTNTGLTLSGSQNPGSHVEGNTSEGNGFGFLIVGTGHFIARNTARANSSGSYDIATGNAHGPIVVVTGVGDISAVTGADHPWANFEY